MGIQDYPMVQINFNPTVPPLQKVRDKTKIDVRYAVISPYAFIHIHWDPKIYEVIYEIEEPILDEAEEKYKEQIVRAMNDLINFDVIVEKDIPRW